MENVAPKAGRATTETNAKTRPIIARAFFDKDGVDERNVATAETAILSPIDSQQQQQPQQQLSLEQTTTIIKNGSVDVDVVLCEPTNLVFFVPFNGQKISSVSKLS